MLFNSTLFLIFLVAVVSLYYQLERPYRRALILLASYTFYWVWSVPFSFLLVGSTAIDYVAARVIDSASSKTRKRLALLASMVFNLGVLALFKYADFFSDSAYSLIGMRPWPELDWVLPLGISFYTFQTMSYTIDVYRGVMPARKSLMDVAIYVSFFPQLVAGPIVRADTLLPQLAEMPAEADWSRIRRGVARILWGLGKKVFIADAMGRVANEVYSAPDQFGSFDLMMGTYAFAVQIYCDFSAYSDIAIGSALLLGIKLPENFDSPYLSRSIREYWRRWHITLSTWLRDYLYIPLGGSRGGPVRTYVNLMVTMVLGGLWHGAGWNWVVWGGIQGGVLSFERVIRLPDEPRTAVGGVLRWFITLHIVCLSWVFFRASDLTEAVIILKRIVTLETGVLTVGFIPAVYFAVIMLTEKLRVRDRFVELLDYRPLLTRWIAYAAFVLLVFTFKGSSSPEFIYFQF